MDTDNTQPFEEMRDPENGNEANSEAVDTALEQAGESEARADAAGENANLRLNHALNVTGLNNPETGNEPDIEEILAAKNKPKTSSGKTEKLVQEVEAGQTEELAEDFEAIDGNTGGEMKAATENLAAKQAETNQEVAELTQQAAEVQADGLQNGVAEANNTSQQMS